MIRESSRGKYPWSGIFSRATSTLSRRADSGSASKNGNGFGDVVLHPSLNKRIEQLASATANTKAHQAPFRNMLFYGPPGTGKTMAARELARKSVRDFTYKLFLSFFFSIITCYPLLVAQYLGFISGTGGFTAS